MLNQHQLIYLLIYVYIANVKDILWKKMVGCWSANMSSCWWTNISAAG